MDEQTPQPPPSASPRSPAHGRGVSMAVVAARAGVSHQTVSRVVNTPDLVRHATREKVEAAIRELGFKPNLAARALVRGTAPGLVGVISPGDSLFGPNSLLNAVDAAARREGKATIVGTLKHADRETARDIVERFVTVGAQGVIVVATGADLAETAVLLSERLPVCVVAAGFVDPRVAVVAVDHRLGSRLAVEHLVACGRRTIAHVSGPEGWFDAAERTASWREVATELGVLGVEVAGGWAAEDGFNAVAALLEATRRPDAVVCANDQVALGVMHGLAVAGVRVPQDVAIIGYDNIDGADHFWPPLTTLRQPFAAVGRRSVEALQLLAGGGEAVHELIAPELVVRASATSWR